MCPKKVENFARRSAQGFLIPVAALLLVGIGVLAVAINQMASQSSHASILEGLSAQAFYAAESGAYFGMNRLMFDVTDRTTADTNCAAINGSNINFGAIPAQGLQSCSVTLSCSFATRVGSQQHFYTIQSQASCGSGQMVAERHLEVSSFL